MCKTSLEPQQINLLPNFPMVVPAVDTISMRQSVYRPTFSPAYPLSYISVMPQVVQVPSELSGMQGNFVLVKSAEKVYRYRQ